MSSFVESIGVSPFAVCVSSLDVFLGLSGCYMVFDGYEQVETSKRLS